MRPHYSILTFSILNILIQQSPTVAQEKSVPKAESSGAIEITDGNTAATDKVAQMQTTAMTDKTATWGHWGNRPSSYSAWTNHSNRLIPVYVFGGSFASYMNEGSVYRDAAKLEKLYNQLPTNTVRSDAPYADQTRR